MAVAVRHSTRVTAPNNPTHPISADAWNADLEFVGTPGMVVGFDTNGDATELIAGGRQIFATWAELAAIVPAAGATAEVPITDAGTHTDPVVGGTVNNTGIYRWSTSPAGWQRVTNVDAIAAKPYADAAAQSASQAAASEAVVVATPSASILPSTSGALVNGVQPLGIIGLRDALQILRSFIAFMPDGSIASTPISNMISAALANAAWRSVTAPNWGALVFCQLGSDGLKYALPGSVRSDGTAVGGSTSYAYVQGAALPAADVPQYALGDYIGVMLYGQSPAAGEGPQAQPAISTTGSSIDKMFTAGTRPSVPGNTWGAVNTGVSSLIALAESNQSSGSPGADGVPTGGETPLSGACAAFNRLIAESGIDPAQLPKIGFSGAHGSYSLPDLMKGNSLSWYNQVPSLNQAGHDRAAAAGKGYTLPAVIWMHGENIVDDEATYDTHLKQLRSDISADVVAITGQAAPVHMLTSQVCCNVSGTLADTQAHQLAQVDAVNEDARIHLISPTYMLPHGADGVHLTAIGYRWFGEYAGRALQQLMGGHVPDCLWLVSVTANGTEVEFAFRVPQPPLKFDTSQINLTTDYGFVIKDDTGTLTLSNPRIIDGTKVRWTINRTLGANPKGRIALDNLAPGLVLTNGASSNLRDSTTRTFTFTDGVTRLLAHWAVARQLNIFSVDF